MGGMQGGNSPLLPVAAVEHAAVELLQAEDIRFALDQLLRAKVAVRHVGAVGHPREHVCEQMK